MTRKEKEGESGIQEFWPEWTLETLASNWPDIVQLSEQPGPLHLSVEKVDSCGMQALCAVCRQRRISGLVTTVVFADAGLTEIAAAAGLLPALN